ncbi:MAG: helix-turn-helix domain-containing protein [Clostridia bacterium]|nr:helix-turn-helix domain-containing protein [Clostridia bacterium]
MIEVLTFKNHELSESFFESHFFAGSVSPEHSHADFYELFITLKDGVNHILNGETEVLPSGVLYFMKPGRDRHKFEYFKNDGNNHFNLAFYKDYFERAVSSFSPQALSILKNASGGIKILLTQEEFSYFTFLAKKLKCEALLEQRQSVARQILLNACMLLERDYDLNVSGIAEVYALDLKKKIDGLEQISKGVTELYHSYPVAFSGLISAFKRLTGETVVSYLMKRRLELAKTMLIDTDKSVLEISEAIGYDSESYFINLFKKHAGVTPLAYRKINGKTVYEKF